MDENILFFFMRHIGHHYYIIRQGEDKTLLVYRGVKLFHWRYEQMIGEIREEK